MSRRFRSFCFLVAHLSAISGSVALEDAASSVVPFEIDFLPLESFAEFSQVLNPAIRAYNAHFEIQFFDMDTDGDLDIVCSASDGFRWWENPMPLVAGAEPEPFPDGWPLHRLNITTNLRLNMLWNSGGTYVFFDVDGDSFDDLVILPDWDESLRIVWHKNFGNGQWMEDAILLFDYGADYPGKQCWEIVSMTLIDIDLDGVEDLFLGCITGRVEAIWLPLGAENIVPVPWRSSDDPSLRITDTGDIDGDGIVDLVYQAGKAITWSSVAPEGVEFHTIINSTDTYLSLKAGRIDPDDSIDVLACGVQYDEPLDYSEYAPIAYYRNVDGDGRTWEKVVVENYRGSSSGIQWQCVCELVDLDNDSDLDIVVQKDSSWTWYENREGVFTHGGMKEKTGSPANGAFIASTDLNFDGRPDLLFTSFTELYYTIGGHHYTPQPTPSPTVYRPPSEVFYDARHARESGDRMQKDLKLFDMDDDGDLDIVVALQNSIMWFENDDAADEPWMEHELDLVTYIDGTHESGSFTMADIDGDNMRDILILPYYRNKKELFWYKNMGDLTWSSTPVTILDYSSPQFELPCYSFDKMELVDMNDDHTADIMLKCVYNVAEQSVWLPALGGGAFGEPVAVDGTERAHSLVQTAVADIDDSGEEVLVFSSMMRPLAWRRFDPETGDHRQHGISDTIYPSDNIKKVLTAKIDDDDSVDVLVCADYESMNKNSVYRGRSRSPSWNQNSISYYRNLDGNGLEWEEVIIDGLMDTIDCYLGDVDGDEDVDLIVYPRYDTLWMWYENQNGSFTQREALGSDFRSAVVVNSTHGHSGDRGVLFLKSDGLQLISIVDAFSSIPSPVPTPGPTHVPTSVPTGAPTLVPTGTPTSIPTGAPTSVPTGMPTSIPSHAPTSPPTSAPSQVPTSAPTAEPTLEQVLTLWPTPTPTHVGPDPEPTMESTLVPPDIILPGSTPVSPTDCSHSTAGYFYKNTWNNQVDSLEESTFEDCCARCRESASCEAWTWQTSRFVQVIKRSSLATCSLYSDLTRDDEPPVIYQCDVMLTCHSGFV